MTKVELIEKTRETFISSCARRDDWRDALKDVVNFALEEAAKVAEGCDKSTHPAIVADTIRKLKG